MPDPKWMVVVFAPIFVSILVLQPLLRKRARLQKGPLRPEQIEDGAGNDPTAPLLWMMLPLLLMLSIIPTMPYLRPYMRGWSPIQVRLAIFSLPVLGFLGTFLAMRKASKGADVPLAPGHPVYDEAHELAARAGVKFRRVILRRSEAPNAFVTLGGTIGATTKLAREFPREEIRAILAHEIGHLRHRHVVRGFLFSLLFLVGWIGIRVGLDSVVQRAWPEWAYSLWKSPLWGFFLLPIASLAVQGPGSRRRELEADRFAARAVGDREILIRALERIHHLAQKPGVLRPADEVLSTHPSLARRIEALRSDAASAL